jgi:prevent-host-death family protein
MATIPKNESSIGVTEFKSKCLGLIDNVAQGKTDRIILLKHNQPVAAIVPIEKSDADPFELWGAMRDTFTILPGVDLTEPMEDVWDAWDAKVWNVEK